MILSTVLTLGSIAVLAAVILYVVSKVFHVVEDERIDEVQEVLPAANCGGCGFPGCRSFAEAVVKGADAGDITSFFCPPGGNDTMKAVGNTLGMEVEEQEPTLAVLACNGSCEYAPAKTLYDGPENCSVGHMLHSGESGCSYGCLGLGECVDACTFDAMYMDPKTKLPVVIQDKCTSCGDCVRACPRDLYSIKPAGRRNKRIWVACKNTEKGKTAKGHCEVACIACNKCVKVCPDKVMAVTVSNNLATIDPETCIACGKCFHVCPTNSILASFEPKKPKPKKAKVENPEQAA